MLIAFDFDGTIAKSTRFHRVGWENTVKEIGILTSLDDLLPYEANLKERFDSYRRIRKGFLEKDTVLRRQIETYFESQEINEVIGKLMDVKESATVKEILEEETYSLLSTVAINLTPALISLRLKNIKTAVISSSRKTIVNAFLIKANLIDLFDEIIGEEDLYENGNLKDKPNKYAGTKLTRKMGIPLNYYIGDNEIIDKEFAFNCDAEFIFATHKDDMLHVIKEFL